MYIKIEYSKIFLTLRDAKAMRLEEKKKRKLILYESNVSIYFHFFFKNVFRFTE